VLWSFPEELLPTLPGLSADVRAPVEAALNRRLQEGASPEAPVTARAAEASRARITRRGPTGALLREFSGILETRLEGDPAAIPLPAPALPDGPAGQAVADVTLYYDGIRLLEQFSDPSPSPMGAAQGPVVSAAEVVRALPAGALASYAPVRVGVTGRAPEAASLVLQLVDLDAAGALAAVAPAVTLPASPSALLSTHWAETKSVPRCPPRTGVSLRATGGRFLWAGTPEPGVRLAIYDPDPGGRPVRLGSAALGRLHRDENGLLALQPEGSSERVPAPAERKPDRVHLRGWPLPAAVFRGPAPAWSSELFVRIELTDLTLRYPR
jgi:hypothetical protein